MAPPAFLMVLKGPLDAPLAFRDTEVREGECLARDT
jgi:hypothetical protein